MKKKLHKSAKQLADQNFTTIIHTELLDSEKIYIGENPILEGVYTQGDSLEEVLENLNDARIMFFEHLLENGIPLPSPDNEPYLILQETKINIEGYVSAIASHLSIPSTSNLDNTLNIKPDHTVTKNLQFTR